MANFILSEKWHYDRKTDSTEDAYIIIHAAAKLIREEVLAATFPDGDYPSDCDI